MGEEQHPIVAGDNRRAGCTGLRQRVVGIEGDLRTAPIVPPGIARDRGRRINRQVEKQKALLDLEIEIGRVRVVAAVEEQGVEVAAIVGMRRGDQAHREEVRIEQTNDRANEIDMIEQHAAEVEVARRAGRELERGSGSEAVQRIRRLGPRRQPWRRLDCETLRDRRPRIGEEWIGSRAGLRRKRTRERPGQRIGRRVGQRDRVDDDLAQPVDDRLGQLRQNDYERIDLVDLDGRVAHRQADR